MEIEFYDHGSVAYVALSDGKWSYSEFPHEQVTLDFDSRGRLVGIEVLMTPGACFGTKNPDIGLALG